MKQKVNTYKTRSPHFPLINYKKWETRKEIS